jgi:hypothetical protein
VRLHRQEWGLAHSSREFHPPRRQARGSAAAAVLGVSLERDSYVG